MVHGLRKKSLGFGGNPEHVTLGLGFPATLRMQLYALPGICLIVSFATLAALADACALLTAVLIST